MARTRISQKEKEVDMVLSSMIGVALITTLLVLSIQAGEIWLIPWVVLGLPGACLMRIGDKKIYKKKMSTEDACVYALCVPVLGPITLLFGLAQLARAWSI